MFGNLQRILSLSFGVLLLVIAVGLTACKPKASERVVPDDGRPVFVVTIHPLASIVREIVGDKAHVETLLPPGASPHTFEPTASQSRVASQAKALLYVDEGLDGWAAMLDSEVKIDVFEFVPESLRMGNADTADDHDHNSEEEHGHDHAHHHDHGEFDPHFWMSPVLVVGVVVELAAELGRIDPVRAADYEANALKFSGEVLAEYQSLSAELSEELARGDAGSVYLYHPSVRYLLRDLGVRVAGIVELSAGREPTPRYLEGLIKRAKAENVVAIMTEPQLSRRPAEVVAEAAGIRLGELDPIGGTAETESYIDLIRFNVEALKDVLGGE